jgi:hypothetical protein
MDQILTSFGLRQMIAVGLKITIFCLSYRQSALRQAKYYPQLRRYTGVGVLIDQMLTTHMNVPGMEPTYAPGKKAHVLIYYI